MSERPDRRPLGPLIAAVAMTAVVLLIICAYQLRVTQVAVVTTFGKPQVVTAPGLHWRLPWPAQKVHRFDARRQLFSGTPREAASRDNINLIVQTFAEWRIADPLLFFTSVGSVLEARTHLKSLIESQQDSVVRSHVLTDFFAVAESTGLDQIEAQLLAAVVEQARKVYGIEVETVGIAAVNLHDSSTASILARMRQEQATIAAEITARGSKEAKIIRVNAEVGRKESLDQAEADARRLRGEAVVKAAEQYDTFSADLEFAIFLRKLDALSEAMRRNTTVVIDPSMPPFDLLKPPTVQ